MDKMMFFQLARYGVVGLMSTIAGWAVFNFLIFLTSTAQGLIINLFAIVSFVVSRMFSFFWTKYWVFNHHKKDNIKKEWVKFLTISSALTLVNLLIIHVGVNVIGPSFGINDVIWANIFFILTIFPSVFGNFLGYKFLVFR